MKAHPTLSLLDIQDLVTILHDIAGIGFRVIVRYSKIRPHRLPAVLISRVLFARMANN